MSYCSVQNVEAYFLGKKFGCDDYLTHDEVQEFIRQESLTLDIQIKTRYSLPITNTNDLVILKMIVEKLVSGTVDDIMREKDKDAKFERTRNLRKEAKGMIDMIMKGQLLLNTSRKNSVIKFNKTDSEGNTVEKRFKDSNVEPKIEVLDRERRTIISNVS